jgi:hypothetical protein
MGGFQLGLDRIIEMIEERFGRLASTALLFGFMVALWVGVLYVVFHFGVTPVRQALSDANFTWQNFVGVAAAISITSVTISGASFLFYWFYLRRLSDGVRRYYEEAKATHKIVQNMWNETKSLSHEVDAVIEKHSLAIAAFEERSRSVKNGDDTAEDEAEGHA